MNNGKRAKTTLKYREQIGGCQKEVGRKRRENKRTKNVRGDEHGAVRKTVVSLQYTP